jgi:hypothetical protein
MPAESTSRKLRDLDLETTRHHRARQGDGHAVARLEVLGAADDLAERTLAGVDLADAEPVGLRVLLEGLDLADHHEGQRARPKVVTDSTSRPSIGRTSATRSGVTPARSR